jgi:tetratricopeptide (TPR) repeat protein
MEKRMKARHLVTLSPCHLVIAGLLAAGVAGYTWHARRVPEPPDVPREGIEPAVVAAVDDARETVRQSPRSAAAWGKLGMTLQAHQLLAEAEFCLERAELLEPKEPRWPYYRGVILATRDPDAAVACWQRAVAACADEPDWPRLKLADALLGLGRNAEARQHWQHLVEVNPAHPLARLGMARLALQQVDLGGCQDHLRYVLDSRFTRKAAHAVLASAHRLQENTAEAERESQIVAALPEDAPWPNPYGRELAALRRDRLARFREAAELSNRNRFPEAAVALEQLVADYPDFAVAWKSLGYAVLGAGDYARSEQALAVALKLMPDSAEVRYYLGCAAFNQGKREQAADHLRKATDLKPDYAAAYVTLAQCLQSQGDRAAAIRALRTALRCRPNLAAAHRSLAELLTQDGQKAEARGHLRHAVELDPADSQAKRLLEQLKN